MNDLNLFSMLNFSHSFTRSAWCIVCSGSLLTDNVSLYLFFIIKYRNKDRV